MPGTSQPARCLAVRGRAVRGGRLARGRSQLHRRRLGHPDQHVAQRIAGRD